MGKRVAGVCRKCGCTDHDCTDCVERTGRPCTWVEPDLCSACTPRFEVCNVPVVYRPDLAAWCAVVFRHAGRFITEVPLVGDPFPVWTVEIQLPWRTWYVARRLLPRLAEKGALRL